MLSGYRSKLILFALFMETRRCIATQLWKISRSILILLSHRESFNIILRILSSIITQLLMLVVFPILIVEINISSSIDGLTFRFHCLLSRLICLHELICLQIFFKLRFLQNLFRIRQCTLGSMCMSLSCQSVSLITY